MYAVFFDRFLTGYSLFIHIILASLGMALPLFILSAELIGIKFGDRHYQMIAKRLATVFVVLFAVGAASGILIALELLLIWPKFMSVVSQVAILPFYIEVFAFFVETIFLGIYIYSWDRFKNRITHLISGIPIVIGSALSAVLITMINAFMNTPAGFSIPTYLRTGAITNVMPFAVFSTPSTALEVSHVVATAYFAGMFMLLAYAAFMLLRAKDEERKSYYKKWIRLSLIFCFIFTIFAIVTGLWSISALMRLQPEKFAAIEGNLKPQAYAPEMIGGIPVNGMYRYYIDIPSLQSILATGSASGMVPGLSSYPRSTWPPLIIHLMFDMLFTAAVLVGLIVALILLMFLIGRKPLENRFALSLMFISGLLAVFALEDGWVMEELGRQPWIIYNVMLVSQAANGTPGIPLVALLILAFYIAVIPVVIIVLRRIFRPQIQRM